METVNLFCYQVYVKFAYFALVSRNIENYVDSRIKTIVVEAEKTFFSSRLVFALNTSI